MPARARSARSAPLGGTAPVFDALGDPTRRNIVARLCTHGPTSVTQLSATAGVTRQAVAKHLKVLEHAGLVLSSRRGRVRICRLDARQLARARRELEEISSQWDRTLARLKAFVGG